jgi:hypothetical protein
MLTSAKIGKQNGGTRTRTPKPGYLNLSNNTVYTYLNGHKIHKCEQIEFSDQ